MSKVNYAAIDIGSNAVRLLIKSINPETAEQLFTKELLLRVPLRLGEEVFTQGEIPASKAKKLLRLMKAYRQLMKIYEVDAYRACATSAMRDAANGKEVIETITRKSGIRIDIINGEEEARLVYDNHIEYLADLRPVVNKRFMFYGFPLKVRGGTGSPIRAVAEVDE